MSLAATSAQAQETTNICDRTQQVVDEILRRTPTEDDTCDNILHADLRAITELQLSNKGIMSLNPEDFDRLLILARISLSNNALTELPVGIFSNLDFLFQVELANNALVTLRSDVFSGNHFLVALFLQENQLSMLPDGIFSGLRSLNQLKLEGNPGGIFRLTVRFDPEILEEDFDAAPVRVVLREGAPRRITVPLLVTGSGGELMTGSPGSLTLAAGSTQSDTVTVIRGSGFFKLSQGELELSGSDANYTGFEIVRGRSITVGGIQVRARVFLEGALE